MKQIKYSFLKLGAFLELLSLIGCSQEIRPPVSSDFHPDIESGQFAVPQNYRVELQGKEPGAQLDNQNLTVSHQKQSKIADQLNATLLKEIAQEQKQFNELSKKNKQLQKELRQPKRAQSKTKN